MHHAHFDENEDGEISMKNSLNCCMALADLKRPLQVSFRCHCLKVNTVAEKKKCVEEKVKVYPVKTRIALIECSTRRWCTASRLQMEIERQRKLHQSTPSIVMSRESVVYDDDPEHFKVEARNNGIMNDLIGPEGA